MDRDGSAITSRYYHGMAIYSKTKNATPAAVIVSRCTTGVAKKNRKQKL